MLTPVVQRGRRASATYRPAGEVVDLRGLEVAAIADDRTAKAFVLQHHYAATYPSARFRFGLYLGGLLHGVAVFSHPANDRVLDVLPGERLEGVELGRFVLLDRVAANGETFFLGRCFAALRAAGIVGVISFSDPVARTSADGRPIFPGHVGTIYQAHNGVYLGRATARSLHLLSDGSVFSARAASKVRAREQGCQYAAAILERHGARRLGAEEDARAWLGLWLPRLTRPLWHTGNHRYVWAVDRRARRHLPVGLAYPKVDPTRGAA